MAPLCLLSYAAVCAVACFCTGAAGRPENIIFILADDHGYNDIGYHGSEIHTPNLDKLAAAGVKLENYYVQPICSPTRSQLLSGRYQIHTGLQHSVIQPMQPNALPASMPTMADELKRLGYSTHMVGKWHLGFYKKEFTPTYRGFDSFFGYLTGMEDYYQHTRCWDYKPAGSRLPPHVPDYLLLGKDNQGWPSPDLLDKAAPSNKHCCGLDLHYGEESMRNYSGRYSTHVFAQRAQDVITSHAKRSPDTPLFMYLPFQAVHGPLQVPEKYKKPYSHIKSESRRTLAGMVAALDEAIGNITSTLERVGLADSTTIIFSTDNGGQVHTGGNNAPLRGWKASHWEGGVRGNGFVHSHLLQNPGQTSRALVHVSDWFPTLVHLAGGNTTGMKLDGYDQWSSINDHTGRRAARKELLHNIEPLWPLHGKKMFDNTWDTRVRAALRSGNWKLLTGDPGNSSWVPPPKNGVRYPHYISIPEPRDKNLWLFDIEKDPLEKEDLSARYPSVVKELLDKMVAYNSTAVPCRFPPVDPRANPQLHGGVWGPWEK